MKYCNNVETGDNKPVSKLHKSALEYAANGFAVFPLKPNTKKTLTENASRDATVDESHINEWWLKEPLANIGLSTSGHLILDVDVKDGINGEASLEGIESTYTRLPLTLTQKTPSGGKHYIFRNSTGQYIPSRKNCPAKGIDSRCNGGYIVAAPSLIDGLCYEMSNDPIAEAPEWLANLIIEMPLNLNIFMNGSIRGTNRVRFIFDVARECCRNQFTSQQAEEKLNYANLKCEPTFDYKELEFYINMACTYRMS